MQTDKTINIQPIKISKSRPPLYRHVSHNRNSGFEQMSPTLSQYKLKTQDQKQSIIDRLEDNRSIDRNLNQGLQDKDFCGFQGNSHGIKSQSALRNENKIQNVSEAQQSQSNLKSSLTTRYKYQPSIIVLNSISQPIYNQEESNKQLIKSPSIDRKQEKILKQSSIMDSHERVLRGGSFLRQNPYSRHNLFQSPTFSQQSLNQSVIRQDFDHLEIRLNQAKLYNQKLTKALSTLQHFVKHRNNQQAVQHAINQGTNLQFLRLLLQKTIVCKDMPLM